jgi:septum formation protein
MPEPLPLVRVVDAQRPLVLASASPRRADLLRAAGIAFEVRAADVDERAEPGEEATAYVERVARAKGATVAGSCPDRLVLAADTIVVLDGAIFGKPAGDEDSRRMLSALSGRTHEVLTSVCLMCPGDGRDRRHGLGRTRVEFARLSPAEIAWYVQSGEPTGKAGAYAIQGLASRFIVGIEGSYSNVVGLPIALVVRMCSEAGILVS